MKKILLIEQDVQIAGMISLHLASPEYALTTCFRGNTGLETTETCHFDLIISEMILPEVSGLLICKKLRENNNKTPVMILTSRSDESDIVLAFEMGADDYMTKPFGILELLARVKALLRRSRYVATPEQTEIEFKNLKIDKVRRKVVLCNKLLELTQKEFDLLYLLASNPGKPHSRQALMEAVWGFALPGYTQTLTTIINRLRIKLETDLRAPEYILTSWGIGYRFAE